MSSPLLSITTREAPWHTLEQSIVIGKDILELLSSSMYVDPMTIYREYVQNATDAIDDARESGQLQGEGRIEITIDPSERHVTIRDNGTGVPADDFERRMTAFGASGKRGTSARGFRGVGRLAGIGYCQELVFRSRAGKSGPVSELRWDCRKLKTLLRSGDRSQDLAGAVAAIVTSRTVSGKDYPSFFFEVELRGIVRHRNDELLSPEAVRDYLAQVAPVPFHPSFPFRDQVIGHLRGHVRLGDVHITINGLEEPVTRAHRDGVEYALGKIDPYTDIELLSIPGVDGGIAALGWIVHHGYYGALTTKTLVRGLRLRCGNVQVGNERLVEELFPEARFSVWCVGEVHILDARIMPNGRRDHFEQNVHYHNVLTHLLPAAREIARFTKATGKVYSEC